MAGKDGECTCLRIMLPHGQDVMGGGGGGGGGKGKKGVFFGGGKLRVVLERDV